MVASRGTAKSGSKVAFAAALALGAVVVNFPLLARWVPGLGALVQRITGTNPAAGGEAVANPPSGPAELGAEAAAPGAEPAPWGRPVGAEEEIPDPFVRQRRPDESAIAVPPPQESDPLLLGVLPEVTLVLVGDTTRRAIVGGKLVAVGDVTDLGRVQAIERDGVTIQVDATRSTKLALRSRRSPAVRADAFVAPGAPAPTSSQDGGAVPVPNSSGGVK